MAERRFIKETQSLRTVINGKRKRKINCLFQMTVIIIIIKCKRRGGMRLHSCVAARVPIGGGSARTRNVPPCAAP